MQTVIFSQGSIFHLQKLEAEFRRRQGERFRLSDEAQRLELIRRSSLSSDQVIQKYFRRFCHELEPALVEELVSLGIVQPSRFIH